MSALALSPGAQYLASSDVGDKTLRVWDPESARLELEIEQTRQASEQVPELTFANADKTLLRADEFGTMAFDLANSGQEIHRAEANGVAIASAAFLDPSRFAILNHDGNFVAHHPMLAPGSLEFRRFAPGVAITFEEGSDRLISVHTRTSGIVFNSWRVDETELQFLEAVPAKLPLANELLDVYALSPSGGHFACILGVRGTYELALWSTADPAPRWRRPMKTALASLAFSPDGQLLALGHRRPFVELLEVESGSKVGEIELEALARDRHSANIASLGFSASGDTLAATLCGTGIFIADLEESRPPELLTETERCFKSLYHDADGSSVFALSASRLEQWDLDDHRLALALNGDDDRLSSIVTTTTAGGSELLAVGLGSGRLEILDLGSNERIYRAQAHSDAVAGIAFRKDGMMATIGDSDGRIKLWMPAGPITADLQSTALESLQNSPREGVSNDDCIGLADAVLCQQGRFAAVLAHRETRIRVYRAIDLHPLALEQEIEVASSRAVLAHIVEFAGVRRGELLIAAVGPLQGEKLVVWSSASGKVVDTIEVDGYIRALSVIPGSTSVAVASSKGVLIVDAVGASRRQLGERGLRSTAVVVNPDGAKSR